LKRHRRTQSANFAGPNPLFERFGRLERLQEIISGKSAERRLFAGRS
jgi:hypothetical protein